MAFNPFYVDLHNLPIHGVDVEGTLPPSFLKLEPNDPVKPTSDITFRINILRDDESLVLSGELTAGFQLECGRCVQPFPFALELLEYNSDVEIEPNASTMDLTDVIRDDILVALPSYPRCEDGNVEPRECPAQGRFEVAESPISEENEAASQDAGVWDALDQLKN